MFRQYLCLLMHRSHGLVPGQFPNIRPRFLVFCICFGESHERKPFGHGGSSQAKWSGISQTGISVNDYAENFRDKRVALVGVSSGRAGNLRGVDHLSDVIAHMGGWVLPNRLPISGVHDLLAADGRLTDAATEDALRQLARQLIAA